MEDPAGRTPEELEEKGINVCGICKAPLAGPAEANPNLPDDLERVRSSRRQYHRWCLASWVWRNDTDPTTRQRIHPTEIEGLQAFRPLGANVWPIPTDFANNVPKQQVIAAVSEDGQALRDASVEMRNDKEVVLAAVNQDGWALQYASFALRNDREVVLAAVNQNGRALYYASGEMKNDKEVVLAAVNQYGDALQFASGEMKNDKEVVLAAVNQDGRALQHASDEIANDSEVVLAADF